MKQTVTAVLVIAMITGLFSCKKDKDMIGEGPVTTETRPISNFTGIDLQMNGNVYYENDSAWKVEVTAKQSIHSILDTKIINGTLVIRYSNGKTFDEDPSIRINVSGPGVNGFVLNTSGNIYCISDITRSNVFLKSTGSGSIYMQKIYATIIEAASTQSGDISATGGTAINENLKTDASGRIDLGTLSAKNVTSRIIGSGNIKAKVSDHLYTTIDGSGWMYFRGNPTVSSHINGTGRLVQF